MNQKANFVKKCFQHLKIYIKFQHLEMYIKFHFDSKRLGYGGWNSQLVITMGLNYPIGG